MYWLEVIVTLVIALVTSGVVATIATNLKE